MKFGCLTSIFFLKKKGTGTMIFTKFGTCDINRYHVFEVFMMMELNLDTRVLCWGTTSSGAEKKKQPIAIFILTIRLVVSGYNLIIINFYIYTSTHPFKLILATEYLSIKLIHLYFNIFNSELFRYLPFRWELASQDHKMESSELNFNTVKWSP
jgi:hypothetical protein